MAEFYDRMAATALRLINSKGVAGTLNRYGKAPMNAAGDRADTRPTTPLTGLFMPGTEKVTINGIEVTAAVVIFAPVAGAEPTPKDSVTIAGRTMTLEKTQTVKPTDTVLYHKAWGDTQDG